MSGQWQRLFAWMILAALRHPDWTADTAADALTVAGWIDQADVEQALASRNTTWAKAWDRAVMLARTDREVLLRLG